MYAIEVVNLEKKFGKDVAVKEISFNVKKGEIFAFLGPNGAGKSTTINMLTTLLRPSSGFAKISGYNVLKEPKKVRKAIGIVFQDSTLDNQLTAYENLYIHGKIYGYGGELLKNRINELLDFVELLEVKDKVVKNFSGGMIRRLEIARSLIHEPDILFLDEPTIGLDPQTRAHIWDYIQKMKDKKNMTIFLTTHYMEEAELLSNRIAIIDHGKIIAEGTVNELKKIVGNDLVYVKFEKIPKEVIYKNYSLIDDGIVSICTENADLEIPKIFEFAMKNNLKILEISYKKPNLNDVFIKLTGREIRGEKENSKVNIRPMMMGRRGF
ncbi:daunorubicin resistance ABC transporter ATPase subunit [Methanococcus vannielii SB]|jgi:ABC-2 type transport system ATP-binding protein|uniref:Daunorubicin resistance ABC transporter ATPase subunit n=1 Tax=Methanococcus vannielii (strain ATCC 35089 / DSM 1224 / JCM 13029 / OCM 148 / SB) TaxID=406327 RepID=A6URE8_METVS|nr:ATP-binding cassette domain-containing protein [Methanococcus vannielii]ABR55070.1 daunorubicin resistance ABC transporter ATPase subunit [Methanococcus vannielii SB]